jgi:predicted GNAT family acetyltransferase
MIHKQRVALGRAMRASEYSTNPDYKVRHLADQHKFSIQLPTNEEAFLKYHTTDQEKVLDYYSTFVPPSYRGKPPSLASMLSSAAMEYARENDYKVKLSCEYLALKFRNDTKYKGNILVDESKL